jgi:hypothetical protein
VAEPLEELVPETVPVDPLVAPPVVVPVVVPLLDELAPPVEDAVAVLVLLVFETRPLLGFWLQPNTSSGRTATHPIQQRASIVGLLRSGLRRERTEHRERIVKDPLDARSPAAVRTH